MKSQQQGRETQALVDEFAREIGVSPPPVKLVTRKLADDGCHYNPITGNLRVNTSVLTTLRPEESLLAIAREVVRASKRHDFLRLLGLPIAATLLLVAVAVWAFATADSATSQVWVAIVMLAGMLCTVSLPRYIERGGDAHWKDASETAEKLVSNRAAKGD